MTMRVPRALGPSFSRHDRSTSLKAPCMGVGSIEAVSPACRVKLMDDRHFACVALTPPQGWLADGSSSNSNKQRERTVTHPCKKKAGYLKANSIHVATISISKDPKIQTSILLTTRVACL